MERMTPFTLHRPASLDEAVRLLAANGGARPISGGTDLIANLRHGVGMADELVEVSALPELHAFALDADGGATLGAGLTLARIAADPELARAFPAVVEAAATIAGPAHRTVATVGGNLCVDTRCVYYNQSDWWRGSNAYCLKYRGDTCHVAPQGNRCHAAASTDLAPALLAFDAEMVVAGAGGVRRAPLASLYREDGAAPLTLDPGEILVAVRIPAPPADARSGYRKVRIRGSLDFPQAGVAAVVAMSGDALASLRVALTGTNSRPFVLEGTDALLGKPADEAALAQLARLVQKQVTPMRTTAASADWRRQAASVIARRLVAELAAREGGR